MGPSEEQRELDEAEALDPTEYHDSGIASKDSCPILLSFQLHTATLLATGWCNLSMARIAFNISWVVRTPLHALREL